MANKHNKPEYKVISGPGDTIQQMLNNWRHTYDLYIISMQVHPQGGIVVLLSRRPKEKQDG